MASEDALIKFEFVDDGSDSGNQGPYKPIDTNPGIPTADPLGSATNPIEAERANTGVAGMLENMGFGKLAAAAGPLGAALSAAAAAAVMAKIAFQQLTQRVEDSIKAMEPFSGQIQAAYAQAELRQMQAMFRRDAMVGQESTEFIYQQSRMDTALADLETYFQRWLTPFMGEVTKLLADGLEMLKAIIELLPEMSAPMRKELARVAAESIIPGMTAMIKLYRWFSGEKDDPLLNNAAEMLNWFQRQGALPNQVPMAPAPKLPGVF